MSSTTADVSTDMEWSNEKALEFLELYQSETYLWDTRKKTHKNRGAQNDAWLRIKQNLSFPTTIDELKKKKDSLMNYYRNHLNKYKKSLRSGAGSSEIYTTNWYAFDLMDSFLRPVHESNSELNSETVSSPDARENSEAQETNQDIDCSSPITTHDENLLRQTTSASNLRPNNQSTNKQRFVKKNALSPEITAAKKQMDEAFDCMKSITQKGNVDEYDHFRLMIAAKIRKLKDPFDREVLMNDIQNVAFRSMMRNRALSSCCSSQSLSPQVNTSAHVLEEPKNKQDTSVFTQDISVSSQPLSSNVRQNSRYSTQTNTSYHALEEQQNTQDISISSQSVLLNYKQNIPYWETAFSTNDLESGQITLIPTYTTHTSSHSLSSNAGQSKVHSTLAQTKHRWHQNT